jgi:tripartite-type tricarboxylate transporter receptor subunit TctC
MQHMISRSKRSLLGLAALTALGLAHAQDGAWPQHSVKVVVPYSAGGSSDALGRAVAEGLSEMFKQPFVVQNVGGAGGVIGSQQVARATPDGYTLVVSGVGSHVIAPGLNPKAFDPIKDFTHIAMLGGPPIALAVNDKVPVKNVKEFVDYARKTPNGVSWGSPGLGTHGYLIGKAFEDLSKTPMVQVAYKGAAPAMVDLLSGAIPASFTTLSTASGHIRAGTVRALAVSAPQRLKQFPNVPTFKELGYPKLTGVTWFALAGPAGMPADVTKKLNEAVRKVMQSPKTQALLEKLGMETFDMDVAQFNTFVQDEIQTWTPMVKAIKKTK